MMNDYKKQEILKFMSSNEIALEAGFKLIVEKERVLDFFEDFKSNGFLVPTIKYKQIVDGGRVMAPFWPSLIYLEAIAKRVDGKGINQKYALEVSEILCNALNTEYDNYRTVFKLIEIASTLPEYAIKEGIVESIAKHLISDIDDSLSLSTFINKLLPKILDRGDLANSIFLCVKNIYSPNKNFDPRMISERQYFKADSYWHNLFAREYSFKIAKIVGENFVLELAPLLNHLFPSGPSDIPSWLSRPAIEEHSQNREWYTSQNILIASIRDGLLGLCDQDIEGSKDIVSLFYKGTKIQRRIAVHIISEKYFDDTSFIEKILDANLFDDDCIHETYNFLIKNYSKFPDTLQDSIYRNLTSVYDANSADEKILRKLFRWLSSMEPSGNPAALNALTEIRNKVNVVLLQNPDFYAYIEAGIGPGPSPFTAQEISYFLEEDYLVQKFNNFQGSKDIFSENREALCNEFEVVIKDNPLLLISKLPLLLNLDRPYQYSIVNSFANLYARSDVDLNLRDVNVILSISSWIKEITKTLDKPELTISDGYDSPNSLWLVSAVADFVKTISRSDENNLSKVSEQNLLEVLQNLLKLVSDEVNSSSKDPTNFVINSSRGRLLEALILLTLGICRRESKVFGNHNNGWSKFETIYDYELGGGSVKNNCQFLCLAGRYLLQLNFMSPNWTVKNLAKILNPPDVDGFAYAMDGLAYAPSSSAIFKWLKQEKVFQRGITELSIDGLARKKLLERLILSYTWGEEELNSDLIGAILESNDHVDLENILKFLWSISNQELDGAQRKLITIFWDRVYDLARNNSIVMTKLSDLLLRLITYFDNFDKDISDKFIALIPGSTRSDLSYSLVDSLIRLFPSSPHNVGKFSATYLEEHPNIYDYEQKWLNLAGLLVRNPDCKLSAAIVISHMDGNPGFKELYSELD